MKEFLKRRETELAAVAFAEEGEFETARKLMKEIKPRKTDRPSAREHTRPSERRVLRAE